MKKKLLAFMTGSLMLICSVSIAQPTITATGINPVIGNSFTTQAANYVSPGSSGAGQTWNLSTMTGTTSSTATAVTPGSTTYGSSFPNSNVALNYTGGGAAYYKTSSSACQFYGVVSTSNVVMSYSNPEDFMHFPFSYNNTYSDPWAVQFVNGGYTFYRTGTTTVTADGYGTLTTPNGTYTNVLRIHYVQTYQDSAYVGTPYIIAYSNDEYLWYKEGIHLPLATVYTLTANGSPTTAGTYTTGNLGIDNPSALISSSNIYPNPATDIVNIEFTLTENQKADVRLFNAIGEQLTINQSTNGFQGENNMQLDVADLSEGVYFAQIMLNGNIAATKRFVITK